MNTPLGFALFETPLGFCVIAWGANGIVAVQLPQIQGIATARARLQRRFPHPEEAAPPPYVQTAILRITALLNGKHDDLLDILLDMTGLQAFDQNVYRLTREIRPGQTQTYGDIAKQLGEPNAARAVGQSLGRNPFAPVVPCHRVVSAGKGLGGFSASGGVASKLRLLRIEGALAVSQHDMFDADPLPIPMSASC